MNWNDIVEKFNNGDTDILKYFDNSIEDFFTFLKNKGLMGEIDPKNATGGEYWQNQYILWLYDNDRENYYKWVENLLCDIEVDPNTKTVYWIGERGDLASLFCDGNRYDISQDTIETILSGEGDAFEPYWDTTDNVYRDVIDELNEKNIERLKEVMIKDLSGKKLSPETDVMETIATNQGHPEYWEINSENVASIIDDEESMNELLDDELRGLKTELYSIHQNSYNQAYESDVWDEIWSELETYFAGKGEWIYTKHPYKKDTQVEKYKVQVNDFEGLVNDYLYNNQDYGNSGTLEYHGGLVEIIKVDKDCLSVRIPDYPDFKKLDANINENFTDFI